MRISFLNININKTKEETRGRKTPKKHTHNQYVFVYQLVNNKKKSKQLVEPSSAMMVRECINMLCAIVLMMPCDVKRKAERVLHFRKLLCKGLFIHSCWEENKQNSPNGHFINK